MCTIGYSRSLGVIFKNRDKNVPSEEEIVQGDGFLAVRTKGAKYYSLGFNKYGCGFVSAAINSPEWTRLAGEGKRAEADALIKKETQGLVSPMFQVSSLLPRVEHIDEWISVLEGSSEAFRGYNILMVEPGRAAVMEVYAGQRFLREVPEMTAVTNHFQSIRFGPRSEGDYRNSFDRLAYASGRLTGAREVGDIFGMLNPRDTPTAEKIWRDGNFFTVSSSVVDLKHRQLYYSSGPHGEYRSFSLGVVNQQV